MIYALSSSNLFHLFKKCFFRLQSPIPHAMINPVMAEKASDTHISMGDMYFELVNFNDHFH